MAKNTQPILKRCKTLGIDPTVVGVSQKSIRNPKPGRRKQSEYGLQLNEKQKAKFIYGVLEKPFRNYYCHKRTGFYYVGRERTGGYLRGLLPTAENTGMVQDLSRFLFYSNRKEADAHEMRQPLFLLVLQ